MALSTDFFRAILAMDSYNRGYNPGITSLAQAAGTQIGNATINVNSSVLDTQGNTDVAQAAGFYAIAYNVGGVSGFTSGEKVIAYRGTDQNFAWPTSVTGSDLWNGYGAGLGSAYSKQSELAFKFYQSVAGNGIDPRTANISLTGHSLGGGWRGRDISREPPDTGRPLSPPHPAASHPSACRRHPPQSSRSGFPHV
jgi:hypothetical protein